MLLQIDTNTDTEAELRTAALLLTSLADMKYGTMESRTSTPTSQTLGTVPTTETRVPPPPTDVPSPPSNVLPFVPPPPPLSEAPAKSVMSSLPSSSTQPTSTQPLPSEPLQYDASGLPWDERIHQKKKSQKKDGTWKLQKGIDQSVVAAVVAELATKRLPASVTPGTAPQTASGRVPAPPQSVEATSVKVNGQSLPLPPLEGSTVPPPPTSNVSVAPPPPPEFGTGSPAASVVPPPPSDPAAGASEFRALLDKITAASQAKQITAQKVNEIVQAAGAPNLMSLKTMPALVPAVTQAVDLAIMGIG